MIPLPWLRAANLALLVLFPVSWFAPLLRAGFLRPWNVPWTNWTFFELDTVTVVTGLQALWATSAGLALIVTAAAIFAPMLKTIGLALVQFGLLHGRSTPVLTWIGKFAMADIFLLSLYVLLFKGMGRGEIEVAWGTWLFTFCVVASIVVSILTERAIRTPSAGRGILQPAGDLPMVAPTPPDRNRR